VSWDYRIEESAKRKLRDLGPSAAKEILDYLNTRIKGSLDPRAHGKPLKHELKGLWRYRVRDLRVLCRLEDNVCIVLVVDAGHRRDVYE
jgi:mRNA interferase RelE/StbE